MDDKYGHSCHIARMNPNHPLLRHGKIMYYNPGDSAYDPETGRNKSDPFILTESDLRRYNDTIKLLLRKNDLPDSNSTFNQHFKDNTVEETVQTKLKTCMKLSKTVHIIEGDDDRNKVILESRSSPTFIMENDDSNDVVIKTPTCIRDKIVEDESSNAFRPPPMDWSNYHRLDVIHGFLDDLEYDYPSICTAGAIGKSLEGRELKILKISNSDTSNACVWIDAGIHAREWIAPAVATYIANHIATNFDTLPASLTTKDWYFLPVVNPDGYEYSHTVDRMWRKNRAWYSGQCVGVDLNRNFSYGWGGKGSSSIPSNAFYRGPEPFSEPESTAVRDMLINAGISFKVYITLHSYGQVIIFPFAFKEELCPDYVRLLEGATVMSKAIHEASGNIYKVGISRDVMYGAAGTSNDWSYGEAGIPFCYLVELRSRQHKFKLPQEEIEETGNEILNCVKALMEFVDKYPIEELRKSNKN